MLKAFAGKIIAAPPISLALRTWTLRNRPLTILCYHTLGPNTDGVDNWTILRAADFQAQVNYLRRHYDIVSLDEALDGSTGSRPRAVLTFDDGDVGLIQHLIPIVKPESLPVMIYVATAQIETGIPFWFDQVVNALHQVKPIQVDLSKHGLPTWNVPATSGKNRWQIVSAILSTLKSVDPEKRDVLTNAIVTQASKIGPPAKQLGPMSRNDLAGMARIPGITIGAHSHGHELLDQIPLEEAKASIARSRELLQEWTNQEIRHFAFPNGNHTPVLSRMVADLGFASAAILGMRTMPLGGDPFELQRIAIGRYDAIWRFRVRLVNL